MYDTEAENIAKLEDYFKELTNIIAKEENKQKEIVEMTNKIEYPFKNILFKEYIQGKSLVTVASEMGYNYEYTRKMNGVALNKFDKICEKEQKVTENYI